MELLNMRIWEFSERLASAAPVPGGGGASALAGAVGTALAQMVGELTVGKGSFAHVKDELCDRMAQAQDLRVRLLRCLAAFYYDKCEY